MIEPAYLLTYEQLVRTADRMGLVVRDHGLLSSASMRPATSAFGVDLYPGIVAKAAAIMHSIVAHHPLVDGNKRLGWLSLVVTLDLNGIRLDVPDDAAVAFTIRVAVGGVEIEDIIVQVNTWLETT